MSILQDKNLTEALELFDEKKQLAVELNLPDRYHKMQNPKKAERCQECGEFLAFDKYRNKETQELRRELISANFCKVKWCPVCAWRKARKTIAELWSVFSQVESHHRVAYVFLTLTTKNESLENLRALSAHMSKSWHRLQQVKAWQKSVLGYIRAIEYIGDKTPVGECHLHYHSVLVVPLSYFSNSYIPQAQWCEMWQQALRVDYKPIVDIRGIRPKKSEAKTNLKTLKKLPSNMNPALIKALCECVKYIAKSSKIAKLNNDQFATLDQQAKGLRQFNKGGLLKKYKPLPADELEEIDPEVWEFLETEFYKWSGHSYLLQVDKLA